MGGLDDIFAEYSEEKPKEPKKDEKKPEKKEAPPKEETGSEPETKSEDTGSKPISEPQTKDKPKKEDEVKEEKTKEKPKETPAKQEKAIKAVDFPPKTDGEFDLSPAQQTGKHVITIYGRKGDGKTTLAFSFPGTIACLTFDNKSQAIKDFAKQSDRITVYDAVRYLDKWTPDAWLSSSETNWRYINHLIDHMPEADWVIVDGGEIFHTMAEMVMRYRNNLMPFQGISNRNVWKERKMYIDQLFRKCLAKSKKGIIWTSYIDKDEIVKDGEFIAKQDVPKWVDSVLYETDVVIKVEVVHDKSGQKFFANIESSKWKTLPTGRKIEVTNKGFDALKEE